VALRDGQRQGRQMTDRLRGSRFSAVMVRSLAVLSSVGLLSILVACGSAPPQATPVAHAPGVPAGYSEFQDSGRGYALAVPKSWIQINVQSPDAAAAFAQLLKEKPQLAQVFGSSESSLIQQNVSLLAVGPNETEVNMVVEPGNGTLTAAQLGTVYSGEMQPTYSRAGLKVQSHQIASLDGYPALRVAITFAVGNVVVPETQFVAGVHGNVYVLTISRTAPALTSEIAGTVRFL